MHYGSETTMMNQQCFFLPLLSPEAAPEVEFLSLVNDLTLLVHQGLEWGQGIQRQKATL